MKVRLFISLWLLAATIAAQAPKRTVDQLTTALAGADAATVAQAAHDARELGDKKLRGPLLQALEHWITSTDETHTLVCLHVLDALIGIGAKVPGQSLQALLDDTDCGVAAFVLLAREPQQNERLLLEWFGRASLNEHEAHQPDIDMRTLAIGNLLAAQRAPGFAAAIAGTLHIDLEVSVGARDTSGHSVMIRLPTPFAPRPSDFPPRPVYALTRTPQSGAGRRLAPGVVTIYFQRTLYDENAMLVTIPIDSSSLLDADADDLGWLLLMAQLTHRPSRRLEYAFVDEKHYVKDVAQARDELQHTIDDLRTRLVACGAMTADEAKVLEHKVVVHIEDNRPGTPPPLPQIPDAR